MSRPGDYCYSETRTLPIVETRAYDRFQTIWSESPHFTVLLLNLAFNQRLNCALAVAHTTAGKL